MTLESAARSEFLRTPPGLAGVLVTPTTVSDVRGKEGFYHYRQYNAAELASSHSVEEAWHLLVRGHLPNESEYRDFRAEVARRRVLPPGVKTMLPSLVELGGGPMAGLRSAVSAVGAELGLTPLWDAEPGEKSEALLSLAAMIPTLLASMWRLQHGLEPLEPREDLDHCADYLHQLTGEVPSTEAYQALRTYLVTTMDHGFNVSTFTARVIASSGADAAACVVGAVGAFTGPLHGGAPARALEALHTIGSVERAEPWVRAQLEQGQRLMGFGHSVYRTSDPRAELLKDTSRSLTVARTALGEPLSALAIEVEEVVDRVLSELRPGRPLRANVEYYAGVIMANAGLEPALFTPTFCVARVVGWAANILEQSADRKVIRPGAEYVGPAPVASVPASVASAPCGVN